MKNFVFVYGRLLIYPINIWLSKKLPEFRVILRGISSLNVLVIGAVETTKAVWMKYSCLTFTPKSLEIYETIRSSANYRIE